VYNSCTQRYAHTYEQFLKMSVGAGFVLFCFVSDIHKLQFAGAEMKNTSSLDNLEKKQY